MEKIRRRDVVLRGAQAVTVFSLLPLAARAQQCVEPSSESLRESLNYQDPSPDPAQPCQGCGFFELKAGTCGHCQIMSGPVNASAHCDSWSTKGE